MKKILQVLIGLAFAQPHYMAEASVGEAKKVKFCDKDYDLDTKTNFFKFGNGKELELACSELSEEMRVQLMLHGASQKVGDSFAGAKGDFSAGIAAAEDVIAQLKAGVWKADREGDARPRLAELAEAIARIKQVPIEQATKAVEIATDEQRKNWRGNAKVKAVIAQVRAEKAAKALEEAEKAGAKELEVSFG